MDDETTDHPSNTENSGLLSPRRIEAIHIAFNKVFDNARKEGLIRDATCYRSFDEVFEIAMKIKEGVQVDEQEMDVVVAQGRAGEGVAGEADGAMVVYGGGTGFGDGGDVSMEMGGGGFSDEENDGFGDGFGDTGMDVEETNGAGTRENVLQKTRNWSKRKIEQVDGIPPQTRPPLQLAISN